MRDASFGGVAGSEGDRYGVEQERSPSVSCDGRVVASLQWISTHSFHKCCRDLGRGRRVPNAEVLVRATDLRFVASTWRSAFTVFAACGFFLDGREGLQAVAAGTGVPCAEAGETVVLSLTDREAGA